MKLEVVPIPVSDIERSKEFYEKIVGFKLDHDVQPGNGMRIIQFTPVGSACSIVFGTGMGSSQQPGSIKNLHLVVENIQSTCDALKQNGLTLSEIQDMGGVKYAYFEDPDGNSWALQEISKRAKL